jgi:hypothetical protein
MRSGKKAPLSRPVKESQTQGNRSRNNGEKCEEHAYYWQGYQNKSDVVKKSRVIYQSGLILLSSRVGDALRAELFAADGDKARFAEKPPAVVARRNGAVPRVKETNGFALPGEVDLRTRRIVAGERRENIRCHLRITCRARRRLT